MILEFMKILCLSETYRRPIGELSETYRRPIRDLSEIHWRLTCMIGDPLETDMSVQRPIGDRNA